MLNKKTKLAVCLTASAVASLFTAASSAQTTVYENGFEGFTGNRTPDAVNGVPIGDIVNLAGTDQTIISASFGYFLSPTARSGNETAVLNIYAVDGPVEQGQALPGTLLFTLAAPLNISTGTTAEGYGTINVNNINVEVGNSIAYTITFSGIEAGEQAGLLFANDPTTIGTNPTFLDDTTSAQEHFTIRRETDGTWSLLNHDGVVDNLNASFTAVPEPSTFALMLGGLATIGLLRRRK